MGRRRETTTTDAWPAWSSWGCCRGRTPACAVSWTRREGGAGVRTRPLAEISSRALRPLLDEESEHWGQELLWDYTDVSSAVASGLERRALTIAGLLEPVLILAMGVVVLLIVLAVLMPIIEINQLVR